MKIVLYCDGSPESLSAKEFLKQNNVQFEEVSVETQDGFQRLAKRTRQTKVPAFELKRSHSICIINGFGENEAELLKRELKIIP